MSALGRAVPSGEWGRIGPRQQPDAMTKQAGRVTPAEYRVLALIAEGLSNREIALALGLSSETIKSHVKHALARMGCRTRAELVNVSWRQGLLPADPMQVERVLSRLSLMLSDLGLRP